MKRNMTILRGMTTLAALLASAVVTRASEQGAGSGEGTVGEIFKWIHFVILAALAYWLFAKVLPPHFRRSADNISSAISQATAARAEAEKKLKEAAAKLTMLEHEVARFREQSQTDAAADLERLRGITKIEIEKVSVAAKVEIEAAERAARVELKALAAKLAVDRAESLVATHMTPAIQEAMINNFVESLQGKPN